MIRRALVTGALLTALVSMPRPADASIILGAPLFVQGNQDVIVEFLGDFAGFTSSLFLFDPVNGFGTLFTNNGGSAIGSQVNLGTFPVGTELIFGLFVSNTGNTFYTGSGPNPDQIPHAQVYTNPLVDIGPLPVIQAVLPTYDLGDGVIVGFEDIFGGGDFDYNDLIYSFQNLDVRQVPEPMTLTLLGLGAAGLAARSRRRKQAVR